MKRLLIKICLLNCLIIFSVDVSGQNSLLNIDSLKKVLQTQKEDTNRVNMLNALAWTFLQKADYEMALQYGQQGLALSKKLNFITGLAKSYDAVSFIYSYQSNYAEALNNQYKRLHIYEELKDTAAIAYSLQRIGFIFHRQENNTQALKNYFASLNLLKQLGDSDGIGESYNALAQVYDRQHDYDQALKMDSAVLGYYKEENENDEWMTAWTHSSIGHIYEQRNMPDTALKAYLFAMKLFKKNGREDAVSYMYVNLGSVYTTLRKFKQANNYLSNALSIGLKGNDKEMLKNTYEKFAVLDSARGNYKSAYEYHKKFTLYKDSILNKEAIAKSTAYQQQYEYEKKDAIAKIEQAKKDAETKRTKDQQYTVIAALGIIVLAVIIIALIQYRNNRQKQKANIALQQQKEKVESTLSELKSTQAQLIQSEKMASLGELTAGIAHEIQNPLNFVNNFSEVNTELIEELKTEFLANNKEEVVAIANDIKENEQKILHHGKRADAIVKGMLQHSRISTGQKQLTDINALADEYLRLSYHGMRAKDKNFNAILQTNFDTAIGKINIVPQDIGRVLLNLFNNAFYAVTEKKKQTSEEYEPTVSVSTKKTDGKISISVKDNGSGISQKVVDKIFQPFFTTKPTGQGTGLGLSLSYDIMKAHGGEIKVETKESEGAEFIVQL